MENRVGSAPPNSRMRYYQDFMEEVLGIPPTTPLADARPQAIIAAGRVPGGPYASILAHAAEEARKRTLSVPLSSPPNSQDTIRPPFRATGLQYGPSSQAGPSLRPAFTPVGPSLISTNQPFTPSRAHVPSSVPAGSLRRILDQTIERRNLPPRLIQSARDAGCKGLTASGNFRVDVSHWEFRAKDEGHTLVVGELFRAVRDIGFISSQIMQNLSPIVMRLVFTTEKGARMFLDTLTVEGTITCPDSTASVVPESRSTSRAAMCAAPNPSQTSSPARVCDHSPGVPSFHSTIEANRIGYEALRERYGAVMGRYEPKQLPLREDLPPRSVRRLYEVERSLNYGRLSPALAKSSSNSPVGRDAVAPPSMPSLLNNTTKVPTPGATLPGMKREPLENGEIPHCEGPRRAKRMCAADFLDMDYAP